MDSGSSRSYPVFGTKLGQSVSALSNDLGLYSRVCWLGVYATHLELVNTDFRYRWL